MLARLRRGWNVRWIVVFCTALLLVGRASSQELTSASDGTVAKKVSRPDEAQLAAAQNDVNAVFKSELAAARKPAAMRELAVTMQNNAATEENPATRYALLSTARRLAGDAADPTLFWSINESIVASFEGAAVALRTKALEQMSNFVKGPKPIAQVATTALEVCEQAVSARDWSAAARLAALAKSAAGKSGDVDLRKEATARVQEIGKLEPLWRAAEAAAEKLKRNPADPEANLDYGRYLCALGGDWVAGLPLLSKASDERLSAAAKLDLEKPTTPEDQLKVADHWWDAAEADNGPTKAAWRKRAAWWYQKAAPQAAGLAKLKIEKRLAEIGDLPADPHDPSAPAPKQTEFTLAKGVKLKMLLVPAGKYWIGVDYNDLDGKEVELAKPFYIGVTEVTQPQWQAVMRANPSEFVGDKLPVNNIRWPDCEAFVKAANELRGMRKFKLRLPSAVEWECACRGNAERTKYYFGNDTGKLAEYAWYEANAGEKAGPQPVGKLKPNALGLYDMAGNVSEVTTEFRDPQDRYARGGNYVGKDHHCACNQRWSAGDTFPAAWLGLRVVCDAVPGSPATTASPDTPRNARD